MSANVVGQASSSRFSPLIQYHAVLESLSAAEFQTVYGLDSLVISPPQAKKPLQQTLFSFPSSYVQPLIHQANEPSERKCKVPKN